MNPEESEDVAVLSLDEMLLDGVVEVLAVVQEGEVGFGVLVAGRKGEKEGEKEHPGIKEHYNHNHESKEMLTVLKKRQKLLNRDN